MRASLSGTAAFNLLVVGMCVALVERPKLVAVYNVFIVTAALSVLAYTWLLIVLAGSSPGVIDVWEAVLTLLFFVALVVAAYLADINVCAKLLARRKAKKAAGASTRVWEMLHEVVESVQRATTPLPLRRASRWTRRTPTA